MGPKSQEAHGVKDGEITTSASSVRVSVLVIGDASPAEFQPALDWLRAFTSTLHFVRDGADVEAWRLSERAFVPQFVLFLQDRPGEIVQSLVERVLERWPLAASVVLLGSWCEGEMRTGRPLAGVARLPWHRWEAAFAQFFECPQDDDHPWRLPRTRTLAEELLAVADEPTRLVEPAGIASSHRPLIAVAAAESDAFDSLRFALVTAGYAVARLRSSATREIEGASAVIWDEPGWARDDLADLRQCIELNRGTPVIAILGMLRWEEWLAVRSWGAAVVIAKPLRVPDLLWHLRRQYRGARSE